MLLLLLVPTLSAEQHNWFIDTRTSTGTELSVIQTLPSTEVSSGDEFRIAITAWTGTNLVDEIAFGALIVGGGCTIVSEGGATSTTSDPHLSATAVLRIEPGYKSCWWNRVVYANTTLANVVSLDAAGTITTGPDQGSFEGLTGLEAMGFVFIALWLFACLIVWARVSDMVVQVFAAVAVQILSVLSLAFVGQWIAWPWLATSFGVLGAYMLVRTMLDRFGSAED